MPNPASNKTTVPDPVAVEKAPLIDGRADSLLPAEPQTSGVATGTAAVEIGGYDGPDPVRYGDWEKNGRCIDF